MSNLMSPIITHQQAKKLDQLAVEKNHLTPEILMEEAASQIFYRFVKDFRKIKDMKIAILAGWGNNGGDALAVARKLHFSNIPCDIYVFKSKKESPLFQLQKSIIQSLHLPLLPIEQFFQLKNETLNQYDIIMEGIFGIGYQYRPDPDIENLFQNINSSKAKIIAIDVPSGLTIQSPISVNADRTYSVGYHKKLFYQIQCRKSAGKIINLPISFAINHLQNQNTTQLVSKIERKKLPENPFVHKYSKGGTICIGGSIGKLGSIIFSAESALKIGSGIALVITEKEQIASVNQMSANIIADDYVNLKDYIKKYSTILIGPGLGFHIPDNKKLLKDSLNTHAQFVLDASFFHHFSADVLKLFQKPPILTPHSQEFLNFFKIDKTSIMTDTTEMVRQAAQQYKCYILLKDCFLTLATPEGSILIIDHPMRIAAQAGSGDILAGLIAGLTAQGMSIRDSILQAVRVFYTILEFFHKKSYNTFDPKEFIQLVGLKKEI
ncbi:MAG: NAD(P)H-hydrate dehydratase [Spirochaetes bacterium]|nr:NAD(P)H-hydrate dehydratase [Spirochaetota bacterium]